MDIMNTLTLIFIINKSMILNKLMVTPFLSPFAQKQQQPVPRLLNKKKAKNPKAKQMQFFEPREKQSFNFDDTVCFTQLHKRPQQNQKKSNQFKKKKCVSQILTIKHIYQTPNQNKDIFQNSPFQLSRFKGIECSKPFEVGNQNGWEQDLCKEKFSFTSHSSRRKYSMNKPGQEYNQLIPQRPLTQQKYSRKKSTFAQSKFPYNFDQLANNVKTPCLKSYQKFNGMVESNAELAKQAYRSKKSDFFEYSIIKPDEIKPIVLKKREQERQNHVNRKKEYKMIYEQMVQQMRRKQQILQRNAVMREKRLRQQHQIEARNKSHHTNHIKHKSTLARVEEKNELKPWEVEGSSQQISNFDII